MRYLPHPVLALLTTTFTDLRERGKAFAIYGGIAGAERGTGAAARRDSHFIRVMALDPAPSTWSLPLLPLSAPCYG